MRAAFLAALIFPSVIPCQAATITVMGQGTTVIARPGSTVTVEVHGAPGNRTDWLAPFKIEDNNHSHAQDWVYLSGTHTPGGPLTEATITFVLSDREDRIHFRLFENDTYNLLATSPTVIVTRYPIAECQPFRPLSPTQKLIGDALDSVLNDGTVLGPVVRVSSWGWASDYRGEVPTLDRARAFLTQAACEPTTDVVMGTIRSRDFFLTPRRRGIWTEYSLAVEQVFKGALRPGTSITVTRRGGYICTPPGESYELRAYELLQSFLDRGERYLLFLHRQAQTNTYESSVYDWHMGETTASLARANTDVMPSSAELIALLPSALTCDPVVQSVGQREVGGLSAID
jgi:hypothetical protein